MTPAQQAFWDTAVDFLNRRVSVENTLWLVASGKRGPIEAEEAKKLAVKLGVPRGGTSQKITCCRGESAPRVIVARSDGQCVTCYSSRPLSRRSRYMTDDFARNLAAWDGLPDSAAVTVNLGVLRALAGSAGDHPDDIAVERFAAVMKAKLAKSRDNGRSGWDDREQCPTGYLSDLLHDHVGKGDPVDVANLAMMLALRGEQIVPPPSD